MLLSCGETICEKHVTNGAMRDMLCANCGKTHDNKHTEHFTKVKIIEKILKANLEKLHFGKCYDEAYGSCKHVETQINNIAVILNDTKCYVSDFISDLKNRIELKREELKLKIDNEANRLLRDLVDYENDCLKSLLKSENTTTPSDGINNDWSSDLDEHLKKLRAELNAWYGQLNAFEINEENWKLVRVNSSKRSKELENELKTLKNNILLNKSREFQHKQLLFNEMEIFKSNKYEFICVFNLKFFDNWNY